MTDNSTYPGPDWSYYCRCSKRQRMENALRPGRCYRCTLAIPDDDE